MLHLRREPVPTRNLNLEEPPNRRWRFVPALAVGVTLLVGSVVPVSGWAATVEGHRFNDNNLNDKYDCEGDNCDTPSSGVIKLKRVNRRRPFDTVVNPNNGYYNFPVTAGEYKIWQYLDPISPLALAKRDDGTPWVKWASEDDALLVTIRDDGWLDVQTPDGSPYEGGASSAFDTIEINFPVRELGTTSQQEQVEEQANKFCDSAKNWWYDGVVNNDNPSSLPDEGIQVRHYNSWQEKLEGDLSNTVVVINEGYEVIIPENGVTVFALCNYGTIKTADLNSQQNYDLVIEFRELFANYGSIEGIHVEESWSWPAEKGSSLILDGYNSKRDCEILQNQGKLKQDTDCNKDFGIFFNAKKGEIQAGNGKCSDNNYCTSATQDSEKQGAGGLVDISAAHVLQMGTVRAGKGGDFVVDNYWDIPSVESAGGQGGETYIFAHDAIMATARSVTSSGDGGDIVILGESCQGCWQEVKGGKGGDLIVETPSLVIEGSAYAGESAYLEPDIMLSGKDTRITAKKDVVIFGGDNWELKLNNLSPEAITAGRNIILAVGNGGIVDLRNNNSKVFKAAVKVEIFADTILLDEGVTLQDLIDAPAIEVNPSKIIYHVAVSGRKQIEAEANTTLPIDISISNVGPKEDTYTLNISDSAGWTITGLPSTVTVDGLKRKNLILNVTLPSTPGAKDVITITATSQTDSKVVAVMDIRLSVKDTSCRVWGVHDKGLNDSQLFTVHSTDLQNFEVVGLGNLHEGYDLESLDINPLTGELYMASSTDGVEPGYLYKLNPRNEEGNLVLIGDIGFTRVDSLSFHPEGVLWGWERGQGLLQINPITGLGELVIPYTEDVEDISWSLDGKLLYAVQHDELLVWDGNTLTTVCSMPRETEGIEAISENMLMFGAHGDKNMYVIDVKNGCQEVNNIPTPYNDIEGIAWSASSCPIQSGSGNSVCGDGIIQPNEQCDDGNTTSGDGCSDVCLTE